MYVGVALGSLYPSCAGIQYGRIDKSKTWNKNNDSASHFSSKRLTLEIAQRGCVHRKFKKSPRR
jgi:hypothetical protein